MSKLPFRHPSLPNRFWNKVDFAFPCWVWKGAIKENGYGLFFYEGKLRLVHRVVASVVFGKEAIDGNEVCHACDNPRCCRPEHLFIGTASDNAKDSLAKGRRSRCGNGRTPRSQSRLHGREDEIRAALRDKPVSVAAKHLGISDTQLRRWCRANGICPTCGNHTAHQDSQAGGDA